MINSRSNVIYTDSLPEGVIIGMEDNTIVAGKKKQPTEIEMILMEVANQKLEEIEDKNDIYQSDWCLETADNVVALFHKLRNLLPTEDLKKMLFDFESANSEHSTAYGDSQFVQGYLEGYKFAQKVMQNKKERTAATVRSSL